MLYIQVISKITLSVGVCATSLMSLNCCVMIKNKKQKTKQRSQLFTIQSNITASISVFFSVDSYFKTLKQLSSELSNNASIPPHYVCNVSISLRCYNEQVLHNLIA